MNSMAGVASAAEAPAVRAATVTVQIVQGDGTELELSDGALQLGSDAALVASHEGTEHRVSMRVDPREGGKLELRIGYARGGAEVIETKTIETTSDVPAELTGPDVRLSVLITPNKPREKIALPPGNDDPLGGLL
ncbi:MAG: hypothetical protein AAF721_32150 [Myxococcota bacterium]